jgi:hypothetical protein
MKELKLGTEETSLGSARFQRAGFGILPKRTFELI